MSTLEDLVKATVDEFPDLRPEVDSYSGLPYIQVGFLADLAQRAKGVSDWDTYHHVVDLIARFLSEADAELSNAIHVSILEHLDFAGPRGMKAWQLMPPELQSAWRDIMEYNEKLLGQPRPEGRFKPWEPNTRRKPTASRRPKKTRRPRRRG